MKRRKNDEDGPTRKKKKADYDISQRKKLGKKKKKKKKKYSRSSSSEDSSKKRRRHKEKKKLKKRKRKSKKLEKKLETKKEKSKVKILDGGTEKFCGPEIPQEYLEKSKRMAPMTKEEWEKKQSEVRRVLDNETGRYRMIRGDGEVLEEIVSKDRHKEINRQATLNDGSFFQTQIGRKIS
ncbi:hypothetical protein AAG570_003555 [Ranatra chinensis]|uniref:ADP-ribosylation factor-like protein 6-interacting protein 4 n=1 Tax=Ranatra chinensis TaxID=642074 RepID=A0ABD0Y409_9HEMI